VCSSGQKKKKKKTGENLRSWVWMQMNATTAVCFSVAYIHAEP
jgi:hypothetical protein